MKGTQGKEEESYPYFDIFPLEREIVKKYNQDKRKKIRKKRKRC